MSSPESRNTTNSSQKARLWTNTPETRTDYTETRRKGDLIKTFKIMTANRSYPVNSLKSAKKRTILDPRKQFFSQRVINEWNILCNKHCCVLLNSGLSNATLKRPKFVEKRGNHCRDTAKIGIRTPLKSDIYFRFVTETIVD